MKELRRRLFFAFFVVIMLALALPILYGRQSMHADVLEDMKKATLREARISARLLEARQDIGAPELQDFLIRLHTETGSRFTYVAHTGRVLGDSQVGADALGGMPSHTDRPEIAGAVHNGQGSAVRHSATLHMDQIYSAVPVEAGPTRPAGIIRVAVPFAGIAGRVDSLALGLGFAALLIALLAYALSRFMLRRLENAIIDMTHVVELTATQDQATTLHTEQQSSPAPYIRPSLPPRREFRKLGLAVSHMSDRVEKQIGTIEAQKAELASILDTMQEGVLVLDQHGFIRRVNPALERMFPAVKKAHAKLPIEAIPLAPLQQAVDELLQSSTPHGRTLTLEYGREQTLSVQLSRLPREQEVGAVLVLHDISEMARLVRMKRDFVANVSHELRTPLTAIQGYADALLEVDEDAQTRQKFIQILRKHASNMNRLVEDLLALSRLENSESAPEKESLPSADIVPQALQEALEECRPLAEANALHIYTAMPQNICLSGNVDAGRLGQVFRNLLENACKYAPAGSPILIVGKKQCQSDQDFLQVTVQDFGPGIPEAELERIFDRFHRVEKHRGGGTGLGLAICKHIVERAGGRIWAEYNADPLTAQKYEDEHNSANPTESMMNAATLSADTPIGATIHFTLPLPRRSPLAS